ncbi:MAG: 1-acyl-sn-glycerol-3-phosphate acyltransferase [Streptosporangiales bacterium]|nr:1-acyl-sn-glycerol-3-phosphate acyltransferase [Streptosporangiales bacterium]
MGLASDVRLLRRGRDWRGRATVPRSAEPWAPRRESRQFPTAWARTPLARAARVVALDGVLRTLAWSQTRPEVYGTDLLSDVRGPVVFVSNHSSHLDTPLILGSLPPYLRRWTAVGAAADYFFDARWRAIGTALIFNAFPVERHGQDRGGRRGPEGGAAPSRSGRSGRGAVRRGGGTSLDTASALVVDGWNLLLFPEATRSQDGWMRRFRLGTAQLCCQHGIGAVPIAVRGSYAAMPRGRNWPRSGRPTVVVRYGRPLYPGPGESMRDFSARLERAVVRLWAEQDVGWWESMRGSASDDVPAAASANKQSANKQVAAARGPDAASWRRIWEASRPLPPAQRRRRIWPR